MSAKRVAIVIAVLVPIAAVTLIVTNIFIPSMMAKHYFRTGIDYYAQGDMNQALDYLNRALEQSSSIESEAIAMVSIGAVHGELGNNQKALDYIMEGLVVLQQEGNIESEAMALSAMVAILNNTGSDSCYRTENMFEEMNN